MAHYTSVAAMVASAEANFSRASIGTYQNEDGSITEFASGAVRRGDRGLLIEPAATNIFAYGNLGDANLGSGSGAGLTGVSISPGVSGVFAPIEAVGTVNGVSYLDWHLYGTNSSGSQLFFSIRDDSTVTASPGEVYNNDVWVSMIAGSATGVPNVNLFRHFYDNSPALISSGNTNIVSSLSSTLTRFQDTHTAPALTDSIRSRGLIIYVDPGVAMDITLRIGNLMVYEETDREVEYIPTTGAHLTKPADVMDLFPAERSTNITITHDDDSTTQYLGVDTTGGWQVPTTLTKSYIKSIAGVAA